MTKATSLEQFQQQHKSIIGRENNDIIETLAFSTTTYKRFGKKLPSVLESAIIVSRFEISNFQKKCFKKNVL